MMVSGNTTSSRAVREIAANSRIAFYHSPKEGLQALALQEFRDARSDALEVMSRLASHVGAANSVLPYCAPVHDADGYSLPQLGRAGFHPQDHKTAQAVEALLQRENITVHASFEEAKSAIAPSRQKGQTR